MVTETRRPFRAGSKTESRGSALCLMEITCGHVSFAILPGGRQGCLQRAGKGDETHLGHTVDVLCDETLVSSPMIPLEMGRELGVDSQRRLYTDNYITGLICDS